jgi:hypothetical protein
VSRRCRVHVRGQSQPPGSHSPIRHSQVRRHALDPAQPPVGPNTHGSQPPNSTCCWIKNGGNVRPDQRAIRQPSDPGPTRHNCQPRDWLRWLFPLRPGVADPLERAEFHRIAIAYARLAERAAGHESPMDVYQIPGIRRAVLAEYALYSVPKVLPRICSSMRIRSN